MKIFRVNTNFYDNGKVEAFLDSFEADTMPESQFIKTRKADCYADFFETEEEATQFYNEALNA